MTNISASVESALSSRAERARESARAVDGKFGPQAHSAPSVSLPAVDPLASTLVERRRQEAASVFLAARTTFLRANRDAAVSQLQSQFPGATQAVFTRAWDDPEDRLVLSEIIGTEDSIDIAGAGKDDLTREQFIACGLAASHISHLGEDVSAYLDEGETEHHGWYEYDLDLTEPVHTEDPFGVMLDAMTEEDRSGMDSALSQRDGRMASMVDTAEIEYQLSEGSLAQVNPELADAVIAEYGTAEKAAQAIADSDSWFQFREEVADTVSARVADAVSDAAQTLVHA